MPYNAEQRAKNKTFMRRVRKLYACELCGAQPVEFHSLDHDADPHGNTRVARLAALGFPTARVKEEIRRCQALCRSCHMKVDGRMAKLHANKPRQKGMVVSEPRPCSACGELTKPTRKGMCRHCYDMERRS